MSHKENEEKSTIKFVINFEDLDTENSPDLEFEEIKYKFKIFCDNCRERNIINIPKKISGKKYLAEKIFCCTNCEIRLT